MILHSMLLIYVAWQTVVGYKMTASLCCTLHHCSFCQNRLRNAYSY